MKRHEITGQVFGDWKVVRFARTVPHGNGSSALWLCECTCGTVREVSGSDMVRGASRSCGCIPRSKALQSSTVHGCANKIPEYAAWKCMWQRCTNSGHPKYRLWGGAGVRVCERWKDFAVFLLDVGRRPSNRHSLDRFPDNNGNYEPGNVRWATPLQQRRNRRDYVVAA